MDSSIVGTYRSNFSVDGFFVTKIYLNSDSTFNYRMRGDLIYDTSIGRYTTDKKYLFLVHDDFPVDSNEYKKHDKESYMVMYSLNYSRHRNDIMRYLIGKNKLFICDSSGRVVKKKYGYSKYRQYLLFGKHWYKRRYYLLRQN